MAGFLAWLPDVLRSAGVDVYVMPGAETRTTRSSGLSPQGVVWHHTATGTNWADGHVAALLRDGRRDLAGPLSQVGIERDGTWVIVALGRANHNGYGHWGNDSIGLEFYNDGKGEAWSPAQVESGVRGTRAILDYLGKRPATAVLGHRETDPKRKIDPHGLDMSDVRARISRPTPSPAPADEEDELDANEKAMLRHVYNWTAALAGIQQLDPLDKSTRKGWAFETFDRAGQPDKSEIPRPAWQRWIIENNHRLDSLAAKEIARAVAAELGGSADVAAIEQATDRALRKVLGSLDA